jgi:lysyl-tRNA synthetase class 2
MNLEYLKSRNRIIGSLREWFAGEGFLEVDTPVLQLSPGMEVHLNAFETEFESYNHIDRQKLYLHTSPEFAMKKLLAGGLPRIFQFAHVFRNEVISPTHYPEFTMLEWYRANEDYSRLMDDCAALLALAAPELSHRGKSCRTSDGIEKLTVAEAFDRFCNIDLLALVGDRGAFASVAPAEANVTPADSWDDRFEKVMMERIEPNLGIGRPAVLCEYPVHMAALSRPSPADQSVAERFELYACGVELANAFSELTDASVQRARFEADMAEKRRLYGKSYPIDEEFLSAVANMPPSAGIALGVERLVMLSVDAPGITDVLWSLIPDIKLWK